MAKVQAVNHQEKKVQAGQETKVQAVQDPVLRDAQITGSAMTSVIQYATFQHVKTMVEIAIVTIQVTKVQAGQYSVVRDAKAG